MSKKARQEEHAEAPQGRRLCLCHMPQAPSTASQRFYLPTFLFSQHRFLVNPYTYEAHFEFLHVIRVSHGPARFERDPSLGLRRIRGPALRDFDAVADDEYVMAIAHDFSFRYVFHGVPLLF